MEGDAELDESWLLDELSRFLWRRLLPPLPPLSFVDEVDTDDVLPLLVDDVTVWEDFDLDEDDDDVTVRDDVEFDDVDRDDVCVVDEDALLSATSEKKQSDFKQKKNKYQIKACMKYTVVC